MSFNVGSKVKITQFVPGGKTILCGRGVIAAVGARKITLADGSAWRLDGYKWGSRPERGVGRSHQRRIEVAA